LARIAAAGFGEKVMPTKEDRDHFLGILAVELGFVTSDALADAVKARDVHKEKSLGRVLVELRALGGEECALLEAMVEKHLQRHGNDLQRSIAALRSFGGSAHSSQLPVTEPGTSALNNLAGSIASEDGFPATLESPPDEHATLIPESPSSSSPDLPSEHRPRFRILRHHASGGLGRVFVAYDQELNREVALKEIHARFAHLADCRTRFLLEAEVTGQLEHPGIVPVYGLGRYANGLPYYAMRFIQGESLKEAIQTYYKAPSARAGQRTLALRHLLGVFIAVCQTVRYAHARGIVHRDLKPDNIMLGKFGETLVVDWGLAKSVSSAADHAEPGSADAVGDPVRLERDGAALVTRAGTVLGTPGYMSPEQADGLLDAVSPASDVYSLGATLYTILTGQAPMAAADLAGALEEGSKGTFPPPHTLDRRVNRALEAICLKAMARLPRDRYPSAGELADDVERWLAYEPVTTYSEPLLQRVGRSIRRHPARVAGLTAAALVGTLGLLAVVLVVWHSNRQLEVANRREIEARLQADARFREAREAVNEFFTEISENKELLKKQPGTQALRSQLLEKARDYYEGFLRDHGNDPALRSEAAAAYYRLGEMTNSLSPGSSKAISQYERGVAVLESLLQKQPGVAEHVLLQAKLYAGMGMALGRGDRFDGGLASYEKARPLLEGLVAEQPSLAEYRYQLARMYGGIAYIQGRARKGKEAVEANARAAAICEELVKEHPGVPEYAERLAITYLNIGADRKAAGEYEEALQSVQRSLAVAESLVVTNPGVAQYVQVVVYAYNNIGHYRTVLGQRDEALSALTRGIDVGERLARENPGVPDYSNILAYMLHNRGALQLRQGDPEGARASLGRGLEILGPLVQDYPAIHQYANLETKALDSLGWAQFAVGKSEEAAATFTRSLTIRERLAREDPKMLEPASDAAWLLANCPVLRLRDPARATALARECLRREPDSPEHLMAYGLARYRAGDPREAAASLEKALTQIARTDESHPVAEMALVMARWQEGQHDAARELFAKTIARPGTADHKHPEYLALRDEAATLLKGDE
jgi:serine/threonine protein kinase/tetratricopeptide (TPR) repeat protein